MKLRVRFIVLILSFYTGMFALGSVPQVQTQGKPKVLVSTYQFPYFNQTFVLKHMLFLVDSGYDVSINAFRKGGTEDLSPEIESYHLLEKKITRGEWKRNKEKYDIILAQFGNLGSDILEAGLVANKTVLVACFKGMETFKMINYRPEKLARLVKRADLLLPNCDFFRNKLIAAGCDPKKIATFHDGVNCQKFAFHPTPMPTDGSTIRIVTVGRLVEKKGHFDSITAVAHIVKKYPQVVFEILGYGPLEDDLKKYICSLDMQENIKLMGSAQNDDVIQFLRGAHIFIHPSKTAQDGDEEGTPVAIYEALSTGVPVVSTYHGGIPECIKHGKHGLLAPEGDTKKLTEHLEYYIQNPEAALRIAHAARDHVEQWASTEKLCGELDQHLLRLQVQRRRRFLNNSCKKSMISRRHVYSLSPPGRKVRNS